jgi:hypothetical protein
VEGRGCIKEENSMPFINSRLIELIRGPQALRLPGARALAAVLQIAGPQELQWPVQKRCVFWKSRFQIHSEIQSRGFLERENFSQRTKLGQRVPGTWNLDHPSN